jgi:hypothetical protein
MIELFPEGKMSVDTVAKTQFIRDFERATDRERLAVAMQVRDFTPDQLHDFCAYILPLTDNEELFSMVLLDPSAVEKMTFENLKDCFQVLFNQKIRDRIRPEFFSQCAASLATHFNPGLNLNLLSELNKVIYAFRPSSEFFMGFSDSSFDRAVAANFEGILQNDLGHDDLAHYVSSLSRLAFPITLEVLLNNRKAAGAEEMLTRAVDLLFLKNKLGNGYIDVCRRVLGDEQFVTICKQELETVFNHSQTDTACIQSVAKLSAIFGEESFHSQEFFESLFPENRPGHIPPYIRHFNTVGFDQIELPLLKNFIANNLDRLVFFDPYKYEWEFTLGVFGLAHETGKGAKALSLLLERMGYLIGGEAFDDPPSVLINGLKDAPEMSERRRANLLLQEVVSILGLKTLHEVVPDVGQAFLGEVLENKKSSMSHVEIARLFPQMKSYLLEDSLGL